MNQQESNGVVKLINDLLSKIAFQEQEIKWLTLREEMMIKSVNTHIKYYETKRRERRKRVRQMKKVKKALRAKTN